MKILHEDYHQDTGRQSLIGVRYVQEGGDTLRAKIRRHDYDHQSHAIVERWDGTQWHEVVTYWIADLAMHNHSYLQKVEDWSFHMEGDLYNMLAGAISILNGRKIPFV